MIFLSFLWQYSESGSNKFICILTDPDLQHCTIPWRQIFFTSIRVWRRCGTCWTTRMTTWKPPPSRPSASSSSPTSRVEWVGGSIPMSSVSDPHSFFANADTDPAAFLMRIWIQLTNLERTKIYLVWRVFWRWKRQKKDCSKVNNHRAGPNLLYRF